MESAQIAYLLIQVLLANPQQVTLNAEPYANKQECEQMATKLSQQHLQGQNQQSQSQNQSQQIHALCIQASPKGTLISNNNPSSSSNGVQPTIGSQPSTQQR